jgi:hypothetical protein
LIVKRINESLRLKWIAFSVLLATIPMTIAGFSIIRTYQENLKKSIIEIEKEKAHMVVERTRAFFEKVTSNLLFLSKEESFRKKDYPRIKEHLNNILHQSDSLVELSLLNEKGVETLKVSKFKGVTPPELRDQSRTEMFRVGSKGRTYYGDFDVTKDIIPTMVIAVPVEGDKRNQAVYWLLKSISNRFGKWFQGSGLEKGDLPIWWTAMECSSPIPMSIGS